MRSYNKSSKPKHCTKPKWYTVEMDYEEIRELQLKHPTIKELKVKCSKKGNIIQYGMCYPYGNYFGCFILSKNYK